MHKIICVQLGKETSKLARAQMRDGVVEAPLPGKDAVTVDPSARVKWPSSVFSSGKAKVQEPWNETASTRIMTVGLPNTSGGSTSAIRHAEHARALREAREAHHRLTSGDVQFEVPDLARYDRLLGVTP